MAYMFHLPSSGRFVQVFTIICRQRKVKGAYNIRLSRFLIIIQPWCCDDSTIKLHEPIRSRDMHAEFANILRLLILQHLVAHYQYVRPIPYKW